MKVILTVSSPPHIYGRDTTGRRMRDVLIALLPACVFAVYVYGNYALATMAIAVVSAVAAEYLFRKVTGKKITVSDRSAVITGLLLAFNLPPGVPFWVPVIGSVFAIVVVKQLFGGLGQNFLNPALAARAFLLASFPVHMTTWTLPYDAVTGATYLARIGNPYDDFVPRACDFMALLFGRDGSGGGTIGEASAVAVIVGGLYLIFRRVINWRIPVFYVGSFALFAFVFGRDGFFSTDPLFLAFEVLAGGLLLGAFFMATDYATSPISPNGKIIMGVGCGFLTVLIRFHGGYPEGVSYAILLMNLLVPVIDKYVRPRIYGKVKTGRKKT